MDNAINTVKVKVNGREIEVPSNYTVLEAARAANVNIPTLCYLKDINQIGACRVCLTEVTGARGMVAACVYPVADGMEIKTNTEKVRAARKLNLELVLSNHDKHCLSCVRNTTCELQKLCNEYGVDEKKFVNSYTKEDNYPIDDSSVAIIRNNNKCILCRRCVAACKNLQDIGVIGTNDRGYDTHIGSQYEMKLADTGCVNCGQCIVHCPTGALYERDDTQKIFDAINDPKKHVAICCAPSVRATLGEAFGMAPGTDVEGKMVNAIRQIGFDRVYNMNLTADMTIVEEATELIQRIQNGGKLPMITSCSPGWIKYCEHYFPQFTENLSTCKSPQQMFGATYKTYWAQKNGIDPKDIFFVSVIPCTAKKFEVQRDDQSASGYPDVDVAITTRELARMIEKTGIDFVNLPDEKFDEPFAIGTGAGEIFGATGGVMEAALRTAAELILGGKFEKVDFEEVRGTEGIKHATHRQSREIGIEQESQSLAGIRHQQRVDTEDNEDNKQQRHHDAGDPLNTLLNATAHHQEIDRQEERRPPNAAPGTCQQRGEHVVILLRRVATQMSQKRLIEVLDDPSTNHTVEANDNEAAQDADVSKQVIFLTWRELLQCRLHVTVGRTANDEFTQYHGNAHYQDATDVHQNKGATTIHSCLIGETPDVPQSYCRAHRSRDGSHTGRKSCSFCHSITLFKFWYKGSTICPKGQTK